MLTVEEISEHSLIPEDDRRIADLLARSFSTDFGGRSHFLIRHSWRHVIRGTERILAHMAVQLRVVRLDGRLVTIAAIADVATDPQVRGQGLAAALLQAAILRARSTLADHVLLYGTARLYAAAGFRPAANPTTFLDMPGAVTLAVRRAPAQHLMVLDLGPTPWNGTAELDLLGPMF
jgi:predicted N-acetyltransferase YhbS